MSQRESSSRHRTRLTRFAVLNAQERIMHRKLGRDLDPLDLEILEKAFESAWVAVKENGALVDLDSDEELEAALRRELIEIARFDGASDAETLLDVLLATLSNR
jgi:hypothetical protein